MDAIDKIHIRLKALAGYVKKLKKYQNVSVEDLESDEEKALLIERLFQLASECVIDVANLINAEYRYRPGQDAHESIVILGEESVLDEGFAKKLAPIAGFRNILVHDYLKIDYREIVDKLKNSLGDFDRFSQSIATFLQ